MTKLISSFSLVLLLATSISAVQNPMPVMLYPIIDKGPVIDGKLNDTVWDTAKAYSTLTDLSGKQPADAITAPESINRTQENKIVTEKQYELKGIQSSGKKTTRILFVGNSFSVYNAMPVLLKTLLESADPSREIILGTLIESSCSLEKHWNRYHSQGWLDFSSDAVRPTSILKVSQSGVQHMLDFHEVAWEDRSNLKWDYVVLQSWDNDDQNGFASNYAKYSRLFAKQIKQIGAKIVLFGHTRDLNPKPIENASEIKKPVKTVKFYKALAKELDALVVPGFYVQILCNERNPDLGLRWVKNFHPNQECMYMVACTFYSVLTGKSAEGAELRKVVYRPDRKIDYDGRSSVHILSDDLAVSLQKCAWDGVCQYR